MALRGDAPSPVRRALVVCDGVTTAPDSDVAVPRRGTGRPRRARRRPPRSRRPASPAVVIEHWTEPARAASRPRTAPQAAVAAHGRRPRRAAVVHVRRRRRRRGRCSSSAGCGDCRGYWLPDDGEPRAQLTRRRLVGDRADRGRACAATRPRPTRRPTRSPAGSAPTARPEPAVRVARARRRRAGSSCAATASGTTARTPTSSARSSPTGRPAAGRPARGRVGRCRLGERRGRARQHHGGRSARLAGPGAPITDRHHATSRRGAADGRVHAPRSSRTSTSPTAAPTCTPSCRHVHRRRRRRSDRRRRGRRDHHRRHVRIDGVAVDQDPRRARRRRAGRARRDRRRHLVRSDRRRQRAPTLAYPHEPGMAPMDDDTRAARQARRSSASTPAAAPRSASWLSCATALFSRPAATQRHAILLTDGKNECEHAAVLRGAVEPRRGRLPVRLPRRRRRLGGRGAPPDRDRAARHRSTSSPSPSDMAADFEEMMRDVDGPRRRRRATLRVWAPQGAELLFVRQVAPTIEDLDRPRGRRSARSSASSRPAPGATSPATTTSRSACPPQPFGQRAARRPGAARRRRRGRRPGPGQGDLVRRRRRSRRASTPRSPTTPARPSWPTRSRRAWPPRRPATTPRPPCSSAGPRSSPPRPATRRPPRVEARSSTSTTPRRARCASSARSEARRDGARHALHQDDAGAVDATVHLPAGPRVVHRRLLRRVRRARSMRRPPRRPAGARPARRPPAAAARTAARSGAAPAAPGSGADQDCPNCGRRTRPTRSSARTAATTSPPARSRAPPRTARAAPGGAPPTSWVAELWIDPEWFEHQQATGQVRDQRARRRSCRCGRPRSWSVAGRPAATSTRARLLRARACRTATRT